MSLMPLTTFENSSSASASIEAGVDSAVNCGDTSFLGPVGSCLIGSPREMVELITEMFSSVGA